MSWIAEQGKIELLLFAEVRERFFRIGTGPQDRHILFIKVLLRVAKLGRFRRSTWGVSLGEEKYHYALPLEILK